MSKKSIFCRVICKINTLPMYYYIYLVDFPENVRSSVPTYLKNVHFCVFTDVILISPGWTTYAPQVRLAKQKCHIIQTSMDDQWKLTPEKLTEFIQGRDISEQKLMILNNPGNPCKYNKGMSDVCMHIFILPIFF